jgi:hypothetical protein
MFVQDSLRGFRAALFLPKPKARFFALLRHTVVAAFVFICIPFEAKFTTM